MNNGGKMKILSVLGENRATVFGMLFIFLVIIMVASSFQPKPESIVPEFPYENVEDVTYEEVMFFMQNDVISDNEYVRDGYNCYYFATDTIRNAGDQGIRSAFVVVYTEDPRIYHAVVAFNCLGAGVVFFDPQTDTIKFYDKEDILYMQWCDDTEAWEDKNGWQG